MSWFSNLWKAVGPSVGKVLGDVGSTLISRVIGDKPDQGLAGQVKKLAGNGALGQLASRFVSDTSRTLSKSAKAWGAKLANPMDDMRQPGMKRPSGTLPQSKYPYTQVAPVRGPRPPPDMDDAPYNEDNGGVSDMVPGPRRNKNAGNPRLKAGNAAQMYGGKSTGYPGERSRKRQKTQGDQDDGPEAAMAREMGNY
jgi:hypothetical protein